MPQEDKDDELIYSQSDLDGVLERARKAEREAELSNQLLWAAVQAAGGHVAIPYTMWVGAESRRIAMWDDPKTYSMNLQILADDDQQE